MTYFELAELSYLIKTGVIKEPAVKHHNYADFGLSRKEAGQLRQKYLKAVKERQEANFNDIKAKFLRGNKWLEDEYNQAAGELAKINRAIKAILAEKERQSYDLEALKAVPIDSIAKVNSNNFFQTNPFRTEKEPSNSLFYYRKDNRAQDFGSGKSYDAIDVFMAVNNCSFVEACKGLQSLC